MEINPDKKKLLKTRIKELESQLEEKSFILKTIKHQDVQTKEKLKTPQKIPSFAISRTPSKIQNLPNIQNMDNTSNIIQANIPKSKIESKRIGKRANSTGKGQMIEEKSLNSPTEESSFVAKEYKDKIEKLKLKLKKVSEKFLADLGNKDKEIIELKKYKTSYNILVEKFKALPSNNLIGSKGETDKQNSMILIENGNLKDELALFRAKLEEKDRKIKSCEEENFGHKLKFVLVRKNVLEKEISGYQEKNFQTNLLIKKLETDVNDKTSRIAMLRNQLNDDSSNLEFEKRPESTKSVNFWNQ